MAHNRRTYHQSIGDFPIGYVCVQCVAAAPERNNDDGPGLFTHEQMRTHALAVGTSERRCAFSGKSSWSGAGIALRPCVCVHMSRFNTRLHVNSLAVQRQAEGEFEQRQVASCVCLLLVTPSCLSGCPWVPRGTRYSGASRANLVVPAGLLTRSLRRSAFTVSLANRGLGYTRNMLPTPCFLSPLPTPDPWALLPH